MIDSWGKKWIIGLSITLLLGIFLIILGTVILKDPGSPNTNKANEQSNARQESNENISLTFGIILTIPSVVILFSIFYTEYISPPNEKVKDTLI